MTLAQIIRQARKNANLTVLEAAEQLGVSERQLLRYEHGQCDVPADVIMRMADIYGCPELIIRYRQERDVFERELGGLMLTNVNPDPVAALVKYAEELEEANQATQDIVRRVINLRVNNQDKEQFVTMLEQAIYDVKTALAHTETKMLSLLGVQIGLAAHQRHKEKCLRRGYVGQAKEEAACLAAR